MFSWDEFRNKNVNNTNRIEFQKENMLDIIRELVLGKEYEKAIHILSLLWRKHRDYPIFCIRITFEIFTMINDPKREIIIARIFRKILTMKLVYTLRPTIRDYVLSEFSLFYLKKKDYKGALNIWKENAHQCPTTRDQSIFMGFLYFHIWKDRIGSFNLSAAFSNLYDYERMIENDIQSNYQYSPLAPSPDELDYSVPTDADESSQYNINVEDEEGENIDEDEKIIEESEEEVELDIEDWLGGDVNEGTEEDEEEEEEELIDESQYNMSDDQNDRENEDDMEMSQISNNNESLMYSQEQKIDDADLNRLDTSLILERAKLHLVHSIDLCPTSETFPLLLAIIYLYEKEDYQAKRLIIEYLDRNPTYFRAYYFYAVLLKEYFPDELEERLNNYNQLLSFDPINFFALFDLLTLYKEERLSMERFQELMSHSLVYKNTLSRNEKYKLLWKEITRILEKE